MLELTQEIVVNDLQKIKRILAETYGLESSIEYPGFLVIEIGGRELHAGYSFDYDEKADGEMFQLYDFTDGYNHPFSVAFKTYDDLRFISRKLHDLTRDYLATL